MSTGLVPTLEDRIAALEARAAGDSSIGADSYVAASFFPVGAIVFYAGAENLGLLDSGAWLQCNGSDQKRTSYPLLAQRLTAGGTDWWGTSADPTKFRLPLLLGRMLMVSGDGGHPFASSGGEYTHTLTEAELAVHAHVLGEANATYTAAGNGAYTVQATVNNGNASRAAGGGQPHNNLPPYVVVGAFIRALP